MVSADPCLYLRDEKDNSKSYIGGHIDDLLSLFKNKTRQDSFMEALKSKFTGITSQFETISYLGLFIERTPGVVKVSQKGLVKDLLEAHASNLSKTKVFTPTTKDFMKESSKPNSREEVDRNKFQSLVMKLLFLARFTRYDILFAVAYLSTKCAHPTKDHQTKLYNIISYLKFNPDLGLVFRATPLDFTIAADASHHSHQDSKGHGGMLMFLGNNTSPIFARSIKAKSVARSSTEDELIMLEEAATYAVWMRLLLSEISFPPTQPTTIWQDNKSCIEQATRGPTFRRNRHIVGKYDFTKELIEFQKIVPLYIKSAKNPADFLTKALPKSKFLKFLPVLASQISQIKKSTTPHLPASVEKRRGRRVEDSYGG